MSSDDAVRVFGDRTSNAELMADCAQLGYLEGRVLDLTYGRGRFWTKYRPDDLVTNDLYTDADLAVDWTSPVAHAVFAQSGPFGTVVFDPPYKLNGRPSHASDEAYGVHRPGSVDDRMDAIYRGVLQCALIGPRFILAKVQDQVSGSKVWQTLLVTNYLTGLDLGGGRGYRLRDKLHVRSYRPQPSGRRQLHARQDYSTLLVFEAGR